MKAATSNAETADRLSRRRARVLLASGILFIGLQVNYFAAEGNLSRTVDHIKISAWLVWALALLIVLASGGGLFRRRGLRSLMDDEVTRVHRRTSFAAGFWASVAAAIGVYLTSMFATVSGREASHIIITAAVGSALIAFAWLERRSLGDG
jgi:cation transport ATPase